MEWEHWFEYWISCGVVLACVFFLCRFPSHDFLFAPLTSMMLPRKESLVVLQPAKESVQWITSEVNVRLARCLFFEKNKNKLHLELLAFRGLKHLPFGLLHHFILQPIQENNFTTSLIPLSPPLQPIGICCSISFLTNHNVSTPFSPFSCTKSDRARFPQTTNYQNNLKKTKQIHDMFQG